MKLVIAATEPHQWEDVREALEPFGVTGWTVSEANGYGRRKGDTEVYRGAVRNHVRLASGIIGLVAELVPGRRIGSQCLGASTQQEGEQR